MFALEFAVGFALADAALAGDTFEGVHFADAFGFLSGCDFDGDAGALVGGGGFGCGQGEH